MPSCVATGFDVELAYLMAQEMGMELVIEDMYFDGLLAALDQGTVDFVMAAMTINDERKEAALFSTPYFNASQAVVVLEDYEGIQTVEDIADKKVISPSSPMYSKGANPALVPMVMVVLSAIAPAAPSSSARERSIANAFFMLYPSVRIRQ